MLITAFYIWELAMAPRPLRDIHFFAITLIKFGVVSFELILSVEIVEMENMVFQRITPLSMMRINLVRFGVTVLETHIELLGMKVVLVKYSFRISGNIALKKSIF